MKIQKFNEMNDDKDIPKSDTLKSAIKKAEFNIMNDDPEVKNKEITDSERQAIRDYIEEYKNTGKKIKI
jgi:hypothetical protein